MKCVFKSLSVNGKNFKVMRDSDWDEYVVKFYRNESHAVKADYHCDDREDAVNTGVSWQMKKQGVSYD